MEEKVDPIFTSSLYESQKGSEYCDKEELKNVYGFGCLTTKSGSMQQDIFIDFAI